MRHFNTTGPVKPADHYCIPPLERFDLDEAPALGRMKKYFVLHAPRQTGKTSALLALCDLLDGQGYACVYTTVESARTARDDGDEISEGVEQTAGYMARCAAEAGHLVVIDQREGRSWEDKGFHRRRRSKDGAPVEVWGM